MEGTAHEQQPWLHGTGSLVATGDVTPDKSNRMSSEVNRAVLSASKPHMKASHSTDE